MKIPISKLSFAVKLTGFLLVISVLPILLLQVVFYSTTKQAILGEAIQHNQQMLGYQRDYLNLQMSQIEGLMMNLGSVDAINKVLDHTEADNSSQPDYELLSTKAQIGYVLSGYSSLRGLVSIDLFAMNGIQYHVGDTLNVSNVRVDLRDKLLQSGMGEPNRLIWHGVEDNVNTASSSRKVIVASKSINRWAQNKSVPAGMLLVNFSTDYLHTHFSKLDLGAEAYILVLDAKRRLLFHPDKHLIGQVVEAGLSQMLKGESGSMSLKLDGQDVLFNYLFIPDKQWYIASVVPDKTYKATLQEIGQLGITLLIFILLLIVFFIMAYLRQVVSPIRAIADGFQRFQTQQLDPKWRLPSPRTMLGEIKELVAWFNVFLDAMEVNREAQTDLRIAATAFESQEGMVVTDADTVILKINQAFTNITGYASVEVIGNKISILKSGRHDRSFYASMWENIIRIGSWQGEVWNKRKNGTIYPEWLTITSVKGNEGQVTHYVGTLMDISARKAAEAEIQRLAYYDSLTQLANRRLLQDRLDRALTTSKRNGRFIALMFIDLDNFKTLNDKHGHNMGDLLLIETAKRISACVREVDTVSRFGGDEFVVMLNELDLEKDSSKSQAAIVAEKIRHALLEPYRLTVKQPDGTETTVEHGCTSSIGGVVFTSQERTAEEALKLADIAMYRSKESGRNCVTFYE